jgi:hypothetical protein
LPFKFNLQRYTAAAAVKKSSEEVRIRDLLDIGREMETRAAAEARLYELNPVHT